MCTPCTPGSYCPEGASAPLPCKAGTHQNATMRLLNISMTSADDCIACPPGSACVTGAADPALCAPGSFGPEAQMPSCKLCAAGSYQYDPGAIACIECELASWCGEGSSSPTPCEAGKVGNSKGLRSAQECSDCPPGKWCSAGVAIPCGKGTWSNTIGASNMGACVPCPAHSTTLLNSSTNVRDCLCDQNFFADVGHDSRVMCSPCPQPGTSCSLPGSSLTSLTLAPGYWRSGNESKDPRLCPTYAGVAGEQRCIGGSTSCATLLFGVYCTSCPPDFYLDSSGACTVCSGLTSASVSIIAVLGAGLLLLLLVPLCSMRLSRCLSSNTALQRRLTRISALAEASGLAAKFKQLISFYQMATSVQSVYGVTFPPEVQAVLALFKFLSLNFFELGLPVECLGLGSFLNRILFMLFAPLILLACTLPTAWWLLREARAPERSPRAVLLRALPLALKLLFVVFPLVSAVAVQAFDCEHFDSGESWLRADFAIQCGWGGDNGLAMLTPGYQNVRVAAALAILIYTMGVPLFFLLLLLACRKQLSRRAAATPLSASLGFLSGEYKKRFFYWEVIESAKKVFFVSLIRLVAPGEMTQLLVALLVAICTLVYQLAAGPFKRATDNFLALMSAVAYVLLLLGAHSLRLAAISSELGEQLSQQLQQAFNVPGVPVTIMLLVGTLTSIAFATVVLLREVVRDWRQPKLRYKDSGVPVLLPLPEGKTHHLFISHIWTTGQDQARVLQSRLQAILPGLLIWLDVEDLKDISALEQYIDQVQAIAILITNGYFGSKNCMRELVQCVSTSKPLMAIAERDPAHGGLTEGEARQQCMASQTKFAAWGFDAGTSAHTLADALLNSKPPIVFERVGVFQQAMLRLIVQRLTPQREIYLPGEVGSGRPYRLASPKGTHHIWCSKHNPGATEMLEELQRSGRITGDLLITTDSLETADHLLLYLNSATWADDARRDQLTSDIRAALQTGRPLQLLHQTDEAHGGVPFSHFFGPNVTPPELLQLKIYASIAVPMQAGAYRSVCLGLFALMLTAEQDGAPRRASGRGNTSIRRLVAAKSRVPAALVQLVSQIPALRRVGSGSERGSPRGRPTLGRGFSASKESVRPAEDASRRSSGARRLALQSLFSRAKACKESDEPVMHTRRSWRESRSYSVTAESQCKKPTSFSAEI